jgi:GT2 family glycosyltransferase
VVVVTWRGRGLIGRCLDALAAQTCPHQVLVVDNASTDGTAEEIAAHPVRPGLLRTGRNIGYAGALAAVLPQIRTPFMAWLNDDAQPEPGWLAALEQALDDEDTAAAAASVLHPGDGTVTSTGVTLTRLGYGQDTTGALPFGFCGGAVLLRTDVLRAAGGIPGSLFCYYEDTDTSWRLRLAGYQVLAVPDARVRHIGGASTRHGTAAFHHWNERNRLLVLLRCAPAAVAGRELARFVGLTLVLPFRRNCPRAPNFTLWLRLQVLMAVTARLPTALIARHQISRCATVSRAAVWSTWTADHQIGGCTEEDPGTESSIKVPGRCRRNLYKENTARPGELPNEPTNHPLSGTRLHS